LFREEARVRDRIERSTKEVHVTADRSRPEQQSPHLALAQYSEQFADAHAGLQRRIALADPHRCVRGGHAQRDLRKVVADQELCRGHIARSQEVGMGSQKAV
jgi:hypothetical protein